MALWYHAPRTSGNDKFQPVRRMGLERHVAQKYGDHTYQFVHCRTGTTVRRTLYHVTIADCHGNRIAYLTNFRSPGDAAEAARAWIDGIAQRRREAEESPPVADVARDTDLR